MRRRHYFICHDYDNHIFPIAALADVDTYLAEKKFFAKLDCSQVYHSVQLLSFNFFLAYLRFAQGLSPSAGAFSSFVRKYLYQCIVADQCFQFVDDLGTAAFTFKLFWENLTAIFQTIEKNWS